MKHPRRGTEEILEALLLRLGFSDPILVDGRESVAGLLSRRSRNGIYFLELRDGTAYAGRTRDFTRRFGQHRQVRDIVRVRFRVVPNEDQPVVEEAVINQLDALLGPRLQNIVGTSWPKGEPKVGPKLPADVRHRFEVDPSFNDHEGPRHRDEEIEARNESRLPTFMSHPDADEVLSFLGAYIPCCVPAYFKTEKDYWSLSCLPGRQGAGDRLHARLSIFWQEVVAIYTEGSLVITFHLAFSPLQRGYGKLLHRFGKAYPGADVSDFAYKPGGSDQVRAVADRDTALALLRDEHFLGAVRLHNLRLMMKGPSQWSQSHCYALVDRALATRD